MMVNTMNNRKRAKPKASTMDKVLITVFSLVITASVLCVIAVFVLNTSFLKNTEQGGDGMLDNAITTPTEIKEKCVTFLVAGIDYVEGSGRGKLTDFIMVVVFDINNKKVDALRIPRDTYIGNDHTATGKINEVYGRNSGGIEELAKVINKTFNLTIDHYITINMDGFISMIDKIGGVDVDVPKTFTLEEVTIEKGMQHMTGFVAEKFVRERKSYANGDLGRIEMQQIFMEALLQKMFTLEKTKIASLAPSLIKDVTTDLTLGEMLGYYNKLLEVDRVNDINFHVVPITGAMNGSYSVVSIKKYPTADLLNEHFRPYTPEVGVEDLGIIELVKNYDYEKPTQ